MKLLALVAALVLQVTGLWPHIPAATRAGLETAATSRLATRPPVPATTATSLLIPVRTGHEAYSAEPGASFLAVDVATATPLYAQAPDQQRPIASVTKLITALVILSRHRPDETVTIGQLPAYPSDAELVGLQPGERYQLGDLVRAALVISANDAADALALYDSGTITKFAAQMNLKMSAWGISGTRFTNPSGLQDDGNYATAAALARISQLALANPFIKSTITQTSATFSSTAGRVLTGPSTNKLLATGQFYGIKTGYTQAAGQCFVGLARVGGHDVITVVLGSADRFGTTQELVNWISRNYQWL